MKNRIRYFRHYLCFTLGADGKEAPGVTPDVCDFEDSNTTRGMMIGGHLALTLDEGIDQCREWSENGLGHPNPHKYILFAEEDVEAGTTPLLPGMRDRDFLPRTRAEVGHVVGQGGICWCREHHADAVPGDPVSLPSENEGMLAVEPKAGHWEYDGDLGNPQWKEETYP